MYFEQILKDLTEKTGAYGAVIIAGDGEAVSSSAVSGEHHMDLIGAQHAAIFNMIKEASKGHPGSPKVSSVVITTDTSRLVLLSLKEGYFLLLALSRNVPAGRAIFESGSALRRIEEEMG